MKSLLTGSAICATCQSSRQSLIHQKGNPYPVWIVKVALDRPYTFIILALLILLLSPVIIVRTPVDIFPNINIPVIAISWTYSGLNPEEFEGRVTLSRRRTTA